MPFSQTQNEQNWYLFRSGNIVMTYFSGNMQGGSGGVVALDETIPLGFRHFGDTLRVGYDETVATNFSARGKIEITTDGSMRLTRGGSGACTPLFVVSWITRDDFPAEVPDGWEEIQINE